MKKNGIWILYQTIIRGATVSVIVVPLGILYVVLLVNLTDPQISLLLKIAAIYSPLALLFQWILFYFVLKPLVTVMDKIGAGDTVTELERAKSEKTALLFPYVVSAFSVLLFSLGGLLVHLFLTSKGGLPRNDGLIVIASAVTCGFLSSLMMFYSMRGPVQDKVKLILRKCGSPTMRPPIFIPISVNITLLIVILSGLILVFMGLFSFIHLKTAMIRNSATYQLEELSTVRGILNGTLSDPMAIPTILGKVSGGRKIYCLADGNFNLIACEGAVITPELRASLEEVPENFVFLDEQSKMNWGWTSVAGGRYRLLSGWTPQTAHEIKGRFQKYFWGVAITVLVLSIGLGVLVAWDISTPLRKLAKRAVDIAEGRQESEITSGGEDETGVLARAFYRMTDVLLSQLQEELKRSRRMVEGMTEAVQTLAPMSKQLVAIAGDQASGSIEQASAAEQASTTSQEIATVSGQIASNAGDVAAAAESARTITDEGKDQLELTRTEFDDIRQKMNDIANAVLKLGDQSLEIGDIIKIIDEISEQTNLLALNASIEAAGAGEYGRRFGVVAQEIRRLSKSTADATTNIKEIINAMQRSVSGSIMLAEQGDKAVKTGREVLEKMAQSMTAIFTASVNSAPRLKEIDLMTKQQATASEQMANTIQEVKESAQQSAAAASELEASVREIEGIVSKMQVYIEECGIDCS